MKTIALVLAFSVVAAVPVLATEPVLSAGGGGDHPLDRDPADPVCISQGPNLNGMIVSSERIPALGFESELANDFLPPGNCISYARWWGGYYYYTPGDPLVTNFTLRFYEDAGCVPGAVLCERIVPSNAGEMFIYDQFGLPVYEYNWYMGCNVLIDNLYWFSAQAGGHISPPQWGRLEAAGGVQFCDTVLRCAYLGYPEWVPAIDALGVSFDCSQEFECTDLCIGSPAAVDLPASPYDSVVPSAWGTIKGLFR
jgi:hypothetical protein